MLKVRQYYNPARNRSFYSNPPTYTLVMMYTQRGVFKHKSREIIHNRVVTFYYTHYVAPI